MSNDEAVYTLVWSDGDFVHTDKKPDPLEEAVLTIDEKQRTTTLKIPEKFGIVKRRTIERRAKSIAKSGFLLNNSYRIGLNFNLVINKVEEIPKVLLQEGHKYSADISPDEQLVISEEPEVIEATPVSQPLIRQETIQTTVEQRPLEKLIQPTTQRTEEVDYSQELSGLMAPIKQEEENRVVVEKSRKIESSSVVIEPNNVLGKFISTILAGTGELYVQKIGENYRLEWPNGKIEFNISDNNVTIISSSISGEDSALLDKALRATK